MRPGKDVSGPATEHIHVSLGGQGFKFDFNHPGDADPADEMNIEQNMEAN